MNTLIYSQKIAQRIIMAGILLLSACMPFNYASVQPKQTVSATKDNSIWSLAQQGYQLQQWNHHPKVQYYISYYRSKNHHIKKVSGMAKPYLHHIHNGLKQHQLPGELICLPMIESAFKADAVSEKGASGIWQISKITGSHFGLKQDFWIDNRLDIIHSTAVALRLLQQLHKEFKGDWLLALAAYNAGSGRVKQAINKNLQKNLPTNYWALPLPQQTQDFVPKFLALSYVIANAKALKLELEPLSNQPYFRQVHIGRQMDLETAAKFAGISVAEMRKLNPAYRCHLTHPEGPHYLLLPISQIATFNQQLVKNKNIPWSKKVFHIVKSGDTLSDLAKKYKTSVSHIYQANQLKSDRINIGNKLFIPVLP